MASRRSSCQRAWTVNHDDGYDDGDDNDTDDTDDEYRCRSTFFERQTNFSKIGETDWIPIYHSHWTNQKGVAGFIFTARIAIVAENLFLEK